MSDDNMTFSDDLEQTDEILDRAAGEARLRDAIAALDERSQLVLQLYFFEEMNLEEIGHVMNVGAARVCQIKKVALAKLREQCGSSSLFWALDLYSGSGLATGDAPALSHRWTPAHSRLQSLGLQPTRAAAHNA
jgi:hypothetical protein